MSVLPFERPRTQIRVKVLYAPWSGETQVPADEAGANLSISYEINGHNVSTEVATLKMDWMWTMTLEVPDKDVWDTPPAGFLPEDEWQRIVESNHQFWSEQYQAVRDGFTEEDWLEETTDDVLVLPVTHLELIERPLAEWRAM